MKSSSQENKRDEQRLAHISLSRCFEPVRKIGFMDGAADGQSAVFQSSFDIAYKQGFSLGFTIGEQDALQSYNGNTVRNLKSVNCQICEGNSTTQDDIDNLTKIQNEKNVAYLLYK